MFKSPSPDTIIAKVQNIENSIEIRQLRALVNTLQFQIQQKDQQPPRKIQQSQIYNKPTQPYNKQTQPYNKQIIILLHEQITQRPC